MLDPVMNREEIETLQNLYVEVQFRFSDDMPWMRVHMSTAKYRDVLSGIPFESLTMKQILMEIYQDENGNEVHLIFDTFEKQWRIEYV